MSKRQRILDYAEKHCAESGLRFTEKRKQILDVLLRAKEPLSAYEVVDQYQGLFQQSIPVMSVYRMLDFLLEAELVHKLQSTQKYMACSHIECKHDHQAMQFLICDSCNQVQEQLVNKSLITRLHNQSLEAGFDLNTSALELHGVCSKCQS